MFGETYHSQRGAIGEAQHVFIGGFRHAELGYAELGHTKLSHAELSSRAMLSPLSSRASEATRDLPLRVLEAGFGSGLNAWLTLLEAEKTAHAVEYVGVEKYPVAPEVAAALGYSEVSGDDSGGVSDPRFAALHTAPWGEWTQISPTFRLLKIEGDLIPLLDKEGWPKAGVVDFDVVYWDAFSPDTQPELWTPELFGRIYETMAPGGVLVTYSAKGDVRRALQAAGFAVEKLPGALGKRHMLRAVRE